MKYLSKIGLVLFVIGLLNFLGTIFLTQHRLTEEVITETISSPYHAKAITDAAKSSGMLGERFTSTFGFIPKLTDALNTAKDNQETAAKIENWQATAIPEGVSEWDFRIGDISGSLFSLSKASLKGYIKDSSWLAFFLSFGLAILGGLIFMIPKFFTIPGIKHNGIYHSSATRGLKVGWRALFLTLTILGVFMAGFFKSGLLALYSLVIGAGILGYTFYESKNKDKATDGVKPRSAGPTVSGWIGILAGTLLIGFYVFLYWFPVVFIWIFVHHRDARDGYQNGSKIPSQQISIGQNRFCRFLSNGICFLDS